MLIPTEKRIRRLIRRRRRLNSGRLTRNGYGAIKGLYTCSGCKGMYRPEFVLVYDDRKVRRTVCVHCYAMGYRLLPQ